MKNLKGIACAVIITLFGVFGSYAQEGTAEMVVIRVTEFAGRTQKSSMITIDAAGKITKTVMKKRGGWDEEGENVSVLQTEIEKWRLEGYTVTHLSTSGEAVFRTTVILER
jgi:hypothetical protein